ncbi:sigma-70 family RNA polymerase sigma factor [Actinomadura sp. KC06]|uniref:RNA polymerase sigma factor n=1 Tax=Actinomadura sp. KC06 TaxID=2530369 RepID=UPI00140505C5|nr:sigma-70 family RNA polymerase sigma factor [Actinomadura sp. KC06]
MSEAAQAVAEPEADSPEGFDALFDTEFPNLVGVTMAVTGVSLSEAQDAVEEAMIEVVKRWSELTNPVGYARKAALSHAVGHRRRERRRMPLEIRGGHLTPEADICHELTFWEDGQWIKQMLETLPPVQRAVMAAFYDGSTITEIADHLGKTEATVRKNLQLARQKLKPLLHQDYQLTREAEPSPSAPATQEDER